MAAFIRAIRSYNNIDQKTLASICGTCQSAISRVERGNGMPAIMWPDLIAKHFGYDNGIIFWDQFYWLRDKMVEAGVSFETHRAHVDMECRPPKSLLVQACEPFDIRKVMP